MIELNKIPITFRISIQANAYNESGWALARIIFNDKTVANFEAKTNFVEFSVTPDYDGYSVLRIEHYGKNYHRDDKFIEVVGLSVNNINLDQIVWDGVQHAIIPPWDDSPAVMPGNLYLGHNGYIEWIFENPVLTDIQKRLNKKVSPVTGQETSVEVLESMKKYFFHD